MDFDKKSNSKILQIRSQNLFPDIEHENVEDLNRFGEQHRSIDITKNKSIQEIHNLLDKWVEIDNPLLQIHKYESMSKEQQEVIAEYLINHFREHNEFKCPVLLFDETDDISEHILEEMDIIETVIHTC